MGKGFATAIEPKPTKRRTYQFDANHRFNDGEEIVLISGTIAVPRMQSAKTEGTHAFYLLLCWLLGDREAYGALPEAVTITGEAKRHELTPRDIATINRHKVRLADLTPNQFWLYTRNGSPMFRIELTTFDGAREFGEPVQNAAGESVRIYVQQLCSSPQGC